MYFLYIARTFRVEMSKVKTANKKKAALKPSIQVRATSEKELQKVAVKEFFQPVPVPVRPSKPEPKNKLVLEYIIYASPKLLFDFITSPSGLSEWFADDVNIQGTVYTFVWDGAKQQADVLNIAEGKSIRLHWSDRPADTYFEFKIEKNDLTQELSLVITDFAESAEETNSLEMLWQGQVQRLMKVIGSKV